MDRATKIAGGLSGLTMLLLLHRYAGINHDSILYLGQALAVHWPRIFEQDLFFVHGSQSRYSIFPWLVANALDVNSPAWLFMWGAAAGLLAFFSAGWFCLASLLPAGQRYWAWMATLCLPPVYGMTRLFSYGERFFTPRPFSEAFCLLAVACLARKRVKLALTCVVIAGAIHPLQAIAATLILWPWLVMQSRKWLHLAWLGIPVLLAAHFEIRPFSDLFLRIDPTWLFNLNDGTPQIFLTQWGLADAGNLSFDIFILLYARKTLDRNFSAWCTAALTGLMLGLMASGLLVDAIKLVLPAELQLWRVHWLAHWFAIAALACLLHHDFRSRNIQGVALLSLAAIYAWSGGSWECLLLCLSYATWPLLRHRMPPLAQHALSMLLLALLGFLLLDHVLAQWQGFSASGHDLDLFHLDRLILAFPLIGLGIPLLAMQAWLKLNSHFRRLLLATGLLPLLLVACWMWDSRGLANRIFESNTFNPAIFGVAIPESAQVFWYPGSIMGPWLVLQRANYFSPGQVAGEIFNREIAIDARKRIEKMRPLIEQGLGCDQARLAGTYHRECAISPRNLRIACEPGVVPPPDFLILPYQQTQAAIGTWRLVDPAGLQPDSKLFLYRCSDLVAPLASR